MPRWRTVALAFLVVAVSSDQRVAGRPESPQPNLLLRQEEALPPGVVTVRRHAPGYERAQYESDLTQLFRDNLTPDLAPFRAGAPLNLSAWIDFVRGFATNVPKDAQGDGNAGLVVIRNGTVRVAWLRGQDNHYRYGCIRIAVNSARMLRFPDTAFVLNIDDFPVCKADRCPFPVFTMYKQWDPKTGNVATNEVLAPVFNHHYEDMYMYPWADKRPKAFMRAAFQGCMKPNASRGTLAQISEHHPDLLDMGLVRLDGLHKHVLKRQVSRASFVSIEDHARWKYLVTADGCVAQTRLAKVMLTNSVVIKEQSRWIEYYYRSLRPWVHFAPFESATADRDILDVVARLQADDATARRIAGAAQRWAHRFLSQYPRLLYLRKSLVEYNALFGGAMERWVASGGPELAFPQFEPMD